MKCIIAHVLAQSERRLCRNAALVAAIARYRCIHIIVFNKSDLVPRSSFVKLSAIAVSEGAHSHVFLDSLRASSRRQVRSVFSASDTLYDFLSQAHPIATDIARVVLQRGKDPKKSLLCM